MKKQTIISFILLFSFLVSAQNQLKSDLLYENLIEILGTKKERLELKKKLKDLSNDDL